MKSFIITLCIPFLAIPLLVSAEATSTDTDIVATATETVSVAVNPLAIAPATTTPPFSFIVCSQQALEKREDSITDLRAAYSDIIKKAVEARKESLKEAIAITDEKAQMSAKKAAYEGYKAAQEKAQDLLSTKRDEIWATFEKDTKTCKDMRKEANDKRILEQKNKLKEDIKESRAEKKGILEFLFGK